MRKILMSVVVCAVAGVLHAEGRAAQSGFDDYTPVPMPASASHHRVGHDPRLRDAAEFVVPGGSRLVVTDADWVVSDNNLSYNFATLRLFVEKAANRCVVAYFTAETTNVPTGNGSSGQTWGSTGLHSGFVAGSGARVVADIRSVSNAVSSGTTLAPFTSNNVTIVLRGYLAK